MNSNNGFMICKKKYITFINKGALLSLLGLLLLIIIPCFYFIFAYWSEMPLPIKILGPISLPIFSTSIILLPFNGMLITKKGLMLFYGDFSFRKIYLNELERISLSFNEWENGRYSAVVKIAYKNGKVFTKDYAKQFKNLRKRKLHLFVYTISRQKLDAICKELSDVKICIITVINKDFEIVFQKKNNV